MTSLLIYLFDKFSDCFDFQLRDVFFVTFQLIQYNADPENRKEQELLLRELDVSARAAKCPYIVHFYGALFWDVGDGGIPLFCFPFKINSLSLNLLLIVTSLLITASHVIVK